MTALTGRFQAIGIRSATVQIITSDDTGGITYDSQVYLIDEIAKLDVQEEVVSVNVAGGDRILSVTSVPTSVKFEIEDAAIDLALQAALTGDTVADAGSTPNRTKTRQLSGESRYPAFRLIGRCDKLEGPGIGTLYDVLIELKKAKLTTGLKLSHAYLKNSGMTASGIAVPTYYDILNGNVGSIGSYKERETGAAQTAAPPDTTPPTVLSTTPTGGATGVSTGASVVFTFSESVVVDPSRFGIFAAVAGTVVPVNAPVGSLTTYANDTVTVTPTSALAGATEYIAWCQGVTDLHGNALVVTSAVKFTTA